MGSGEFLPRPSFLFLAGPTGWLVPGVLKYHRMRGMTLNLLVTPGLALEHGEEFHPARPNWNGRRNWSR
jgi:hypothetical protein